MFEGREISYQDLQSEEDASKAQDYLKRRMQNQTIPQEVASAFNNLNEALELYL